MRGVNTRAIELTEALLVLSRPTVLQPCALAEQRGVTTETSGAVTSTFGSHALLLQLTTNLIHNAIVHNVPEHGTVAASGSVEDGSVVRRVESTGEQLSPPMDRQEHHRGPRRDAHRRTASWGWTSRDRPAPPRPIHAARGVR